MIFDVDYFYHRLHYLVFCVAFLRSVSDFVLTCCSLTPSDFLDLPWTGVFSMQEISTIFAVN